LKISTKIITNNKDMSFVNIMKARDFIYQYQKFKMWYKKINAVNRKKTEHENKGN
jgi:hypothetical protein